MKAEFEKNGYFAAKQAISPEEVNTLINETKIFENQKNNYGIRDLFNKLPYLKKLVSSKPIRVVVEEILGKKAFPVRSIFFDKVPGANWNVPWHQDTSIAIKKKAKVADFKLWSIKQGIAHVEPPEQYLRNMLTLRIHLDHTTTENGVLRILPGTHLKGRLNSKTILHLVETMKPLECESTPGDIILMCPLLLHSSRKAVNPSHRRIIHIEFSAMALPSPLEWYEKVT
jgi:ectoine hydroxylase-related dioxygenase (phytanoyl-CoA dioxygenase family)